MPKKKRHISDSVKETNLRHINEIIARSHPEVFLVDADAPLEKKTKDKELLDRLMKIEQAIIERARAKGIIKD